MAVRPDSGLPPVPHIGPPKAEDPLAQSLPPGRVIRAFDDARRADRGPCYWHEGRYLSVRRRQGKGRHGFCTYYERPGQAPRRYCRDALPVRPTRAQAEQDLVKWAESLHLMRVDR